MANLLTQVVDSGYRYLVMGPKYRSGLSSLLLLAIIFSLFINEAMSSECLFQKLRAPNVSQSESSNRKAPLGLQEYERAEREFRSTFGRQPSIIMHAHGEFRYIEGNVSKAIVKGGLHTRSGVEFLKKIRPDLAPDIVIRSHPNGAGVVEIPEGAFLRSQLDSLSPQNMVTKTAADGSRVRFVKKSLYPKNWNEEVILSSIDSLKNNRASIRRFDGRVFRINGSYEGIKIEVITGREGNLITAYPLLEQ